ncbi:MAG: ABC transporter permease [Burkholderiaceae bacterium]
MLIVVLATLSATALFSERLEKSLTASATKAIGADFVIVSDQAISSELFVLARQYDLRNAHTVTLNSMVSANDRAQLVALKAIQGSYPLRGQVETADVRQGPPSVARRGLAQGKVWVDEAVLDALGAAVGSVLQVGEARLTVDKILITEPDRGLSFINLAPRIMMNALDLPATGLIQPGSRASYRLLVAGKALDLQGFERATKPLLKPGQRFETLASGRPELQATLDRAHKLLGLIALIAVVISLIGISLIARDYIQQNTSVVAILKVHGFTKSQLCRLWAGGLCLIGLLCGALGLSAGWILQFGLEMILRSVLDISAESISWSSLLMPFWCAAMILTCFVFVPLLSVFSSVPADLFRQASLRKNALLVIGLQALALFGMTFLLVGNLIFVMYTLAGVLALLALFALLVVLVTRHGLCLPLFKTIQEQPLWMKSLRFAWTSMRRRLGQTAMQTVVLTVGLTALLVLALIKSDLVESWKSTIAPDAPNRFAINIQNDQRTDFEDMLKTIEVRQVTLYPMIKARLLAINERNLTTQALDDQARRLVNREFNLSFNRELPVGNRLIAGEWRDISLKVPQISVEAGVAKTLGIALGDRLHFEIQGQAYDFKVSSLRALRWDSMQVNFFLIVPDQSLQALTQNWITAFFLPPHQVAQASRLVSAFPNVTLVDTGAIIRQITSVLLPMVSAVQYGFGFTLVTGVAALFIVIFCSLRSRMQEAAVLRALGASRLQIACSIGLELMSIGLLAGLIAALSAQCLAAALAYYGFDFMYRWTIWPFLYGPLAGAGIAFLTGLWSIQRIASSPPLLVLRDAGA